MSVEYPPEFLTAGADAREIHLREPGHPEPSPAPDLPDQYHEDRLVLLVRDPNTLFAAWEIRGDHHARAWEAIGGPGAHVALRILAYPSEEVVCDVNVDGAHSWYLRLMRPGLACRGQIGLKSENSFWVFATSPVVHFPTGRESDVVDADWATIDEVLVRSRTGHAHTTPSSHTVHLSAASHI